MISERVIRRILEDINACSGERIGVRLPGGEEIPAGPVEHRVIFRTARALRETLRDPEMGFAEGYVRGDIEVEGDLEKFLVAGITYVNRIEGGGRIPRMLRKVAGGMSFINRLREQENVRRHYDLGDEFYRLWLDSSMTYSCAYFNPPHLSLEEAQRRKREVIYRKLMLEEGDRLLDIGCGWGSLILESAELLGVRAVGITLSENQFRYVREEIKRRGLEDRVRVFLMHYADLPTLGERFNKVVSVGMFEHVGAENYRIFFRTVERVMERGGLFLLHTIGKVHPDVQSRWIRKYIFPGGYIPSLPEIIDAFEGTDFSFIDLDDWRPHYYRTLKEWRRRFWAKVEKVWEMYGERFVRMWNLYLTASAVSFYTGSNHLFQILLSKGVRNDYPTLERVLSESPVLVEEALLHTADEVLDKGIR